MTENIQKSLLDAVNRYEKQEEGKKTFIFYEMAQKKYSSSLSRQSSNVTEIEVNSDHRSKLLKLENLLR